MSSDTSTVSPTAPPADNCQTVQLKTPATENTKQCKSTTNCSGCTTDNITKTDNQKAEGHDHNEHDNDQDEDEEQVNAPSELDEDECEDLDDAENEQQPSAPGSSPVAKIVIPRPICPDCYLGNYCDQEKDIKNAGGIPKYGHIRRRVVPSNVVQLKKILGTILKKLESGIPLVPNPHTTINKHSTQILAFCIHCQSGSCDRLTPGYYHLSNQIIPPSTELVARLIEKVSKQQQSEELVATADRYLSQRSTNNYKPKQGRGGNQTNVRNVPHAPINTRNNQQPAEQSAENPINHNLVHTYNEGLPRPPRGGYQGRGRGGYQHPTGYQPRGRGGYQRPPVATTSN